jgi:hypothetical protein
MIPDPSSPGGIALGDSLADYFTTRAAEFKVDYVLWRGRMWQGGRWTDSGESAHYDHVHLTTTPTPLATGGEAHAPAPQGGGATPGSPCAGLGGNLAPGTVPAEFLPWIKKAGSLCPQVTPSLIAAQIDAESAFHTDAVSPAGAQGPAQFMPGTWPSYGKDDDANGATSPFDVGDAVMAQGRFMCEIAAAIDPKVADGSVRAPNGTTELYLAGYNAGPGSVIRAGGFPTGHPDYVNQTRPYADKIIDLEPHYRGAAA